MNVQITHVIVHDPEQVRGILVEAQTIASELAHDPVTHERYFNAAVQLLGQRYTLAASAQPVQMPAMALPTNMGRR
jgi:hypothetical protein